MCPGASTAPRAPGPSPSQTCCEDRSLQHEWMHEGIMSHVIYNLHIMSPLPCVLWVRSQSQATPHSRGGDAARVRPLGGEVHFRSCLPHCLGFPGGSVVCTPMREAPPPLLLEPSDAPLNSSRLPQCPKYHAWGQRLISLSFPCLISGRNEKHKQFYDVSPSLKF